MYEYSILHTILIIILTQTEAPDVLIERHTKIIDVVIDMTMSAQKFFFLRTSKILMVT